MVVTVRLFASYRESAGWGEKRTEVPEGQTAREVWERLRPELGSARAAPLCAVNRDHVPLDHLLEAGDEVAFFPPVSGGEGRIAGAPLDPEALVREARTDACGCVVAFTGVVRDHHEGRAVEAVTYEAYTEMAERELDRIVTEAEERWPGVRARVLHRVGRMEVGETVVAIAAAAPHREEAFEACRFLIEEIKRTVPIWKKDHFAAGEASWRDG